MKKKIFSIFLVMVLCIGMTAGCKKNVGTSQDNAIAEEDDDSKEEAKSYRFGFSCITMENPYYITLEQALREAVEAQGSTLVTKDPALNVDTQIEQIHQMIKDGLDAIFLCPVSRDAITPALEELKEADVKIINIDTRKIHLNKFNLELTDDFRIIRILNKCITKHQLGAEICFCCKRANHICSCVVIAELWRLEDVRNFFYILVIHIQ